MRITTQIKLKPHLIEWLTTINGEKDSGIIASKKNYVGYYIYPNLQLPPDNWEELLQKAEPNCSIQLMNADSKDIKYNWFIHPNKWYYIQNRLDLMFDKIFLEYMLEKLKVGESDIDIHKTIWDFIEEYNLSPSRFDMLKQRYYRIRKKMLKKKKNLLRNSSNLSRICHSSNSNKTNTL